MELTYSEFSIPLNWMPNMDKAIESVRTKTKAIAEVAMCYTGDIQDKNRTKYTLQYYRQFAKDIENSGAHILAIKDMSGLLKPSAAFELISELNKPSAFQFTCIHMILLHFNLLHT
jgi:pyruvate carboxylase